MTKRLVCIGECMLELAPSGEDAMFRRAFAGDSFNTAWYAKRLRPDWAVDYVTGAGDDAASGQMLDFIAGCGIGVDHVQRVAGRTVGLYMIELQDGERSFSYWRGQSAAKALAADVAALRAAVAGADIVYFSGITLAVLEGDGRENLLRVMREVRDAGATVAFDPNLRPKLWTNDANMCAAIMSAAAVSDLVLPSHEDEATFFGDADPAATLERYQSAGASVVVVKNGAGEVLFSQDSETGVHRPCVVSVVVDSTAAGDSFNAGFFASMDKGIAPAVAAACELSAKVIGARGALVEH